MVMAVLSKIAEQILLFYMVILTRTYTITVKAIDDIAGPKGTATASTQVVVKGPLLVNLVLIQVLDVFLWIQN